MSFCRLSRASRRPSGGRLPAVFLLALALPLRAATAAAANPAEIPLAAGDFVHATVQQRFDVRVELLDPDGREVLHVDGPHGIREDEELAAVVERAGLYRLRVLLCPEGVPPDACYTLRLAPPRPATEADRRRAEAVRATQAAAEAMFKKTDESLRFQLATRERALALWRSLDERHRVAEELFQLGIAQRLLHQHEPATQRLHEAAEIYAGLGSPGGEARALNEAGLTRADAGQLAEAVADFRQALPRARQGGDRKQQGDILNNLGLYLGRLGQGREGIPHLEEALRIARDHKDVATQVTVLGNLGFTYELLLERQKALDHYQRALALSSAAPEVQAATVVIHNNLGSFHELIGNWDEAQRHLTLAVELLETLGDKRRMAATRNNLGLLYSRSGQDERARSSFAKALALARETEHLEVQVHALNNLGVLDWRRKRTQDALTHWRQVEPLAAGRPELEQVATWARAFVQAGEGRLDDARDTLMQGLSRSQSRGDRSWESQQRLALAQVEQERGNLMAALMHAEAGVEAIESLRGRVVNPDLRALFLASNQSYYEREIDILMELHRRQPGQGYDARALRVSEQARARSLLELLGEAGADLRRGVDPQLLEQERRARAVVRELDRYRMDLMLQNPEPARLAEATRRLDDALAEHERVESEVRSRSRTYAALTQQQPLDHVEVQSRVLGEGTLLLEYALGEERSYVWAITPDALHSFELPARREIEKVGLDLYRALTARNDSGQPAKPNAAEADLRAERAGRLLSEMVLQPVAPLLGDNVLLVVPDGVLQYVPFAALPLPSSPADRPERVIARNQVVTLPSASTLAVLRTQIAGRAAAPKMLAVLADPVFAGDPRVAQALRTLSPAKHRGDLARLPFSEEEARGILSLVPEADQKLAALGFDASYARATGGELAQYRNVHFATHGLIDNKQPELSKLALSQFDEKGRLREESFLRLADIYNLELNADLVVLSACQTALGQEVRREGLIGLTRGFMYAGAARVLASLWSVEDKATAKLMKKFYKHLLVDRRSAPDALRRAQLEMADDPRYRSPYFWAGFSLQGEWK